VSGNCQANQANCTYSVPTKQPSDVPEHQAPSNRHQFSATQANTNTRDKSWDNSLPTPTVIFVCKREGCESCCERHTPGGTAVFV
jgi:hypothetical protein